MISSDLEGFTFFSGLAADAPPAQPELRPWCMILTDTLPESLDGPYPGLKACSGDSGRRLRDHGRAELEASVGGLRSAGHHLLGLVAVGPEGSRVRRKRLRRQRRRGNENPSRSKNRRGAEPSMSRRRRRRGGLNRGKSRRRLPSRQCRQLFRRPDQTG